MTGETPPEQKLPQVTIVGLNHIRVQTLVAIASQLYDGARLWRYGKVTQAELLQFAEFFESELRRRDGAAADRLATDRSSRVSRSKRGARS
ncbi:hypothetical protein [Acidisoma silvae]|uniref:Uncharacterized protein n=1 Tax=Acidisoma silvae TaxID=2802396 RepID=A0A963YWR7_9PROT|nr:hypothetical protein [Acidisoma silvae]MCB8878274.1 hypothetical protein [Acidisoma silvae]